MKLKVLQENLKLALNHVQRAVSSKPQLPILASILITAHEDYLEIAATDLYMGIKAKVLGTITETGSLALPGKMLVEAISNLPAGTLELESDGSNLVIKSQVGTTKLQGQASDEFPPFPEITGQKLEVPSRLLTEADAMVRFATSVDVTRPVLTSLNFSITEAGLEIVGTDGFRLAVLKQPDFPTSDAQPMLLPAKALGELCKILSAEKAENVAFTLSEQLKQLWFVINDVEVFVRLIEGDYPPYQKIMPSSVTFEATFDGEEFAAQLKRTLVFARDTSNIVKLNFTKETLTITSNASTFGDYTGSLPIKLQAGEGGLIAFNGRYLQDFLNTFKPKSIWFGMNESLKPAVFRPEGLSNFSYIVMPFRVNDSQ